MKLFTIILEVITREKHKEQNARTLRHIRGFICNVYSSCQYIGGKGDENYLEGRYGLNK